MLLYIVKRLGVLFEVGHRADPLGGPSFEFGKVACAAFDLADAAGRHAERLADLLLGDVPADAQFAQPGRRFRPESRVRPRRCVWGHERPVCLAGDEPLDAADDLELALALAGLFGDVVLGGLVVSQADDGDAVQRHVALPVAAFVEPAPVGPAAGRGDGAGSVSFAKFSPAVGAIHSCRSGLPPETACIWMGSRPP